MILFNINDLFAHSLILLSMSIYCLHTVKWFLLLLYNTNDFI